MRDVRVVLRDVSSPSAMAEAEAIDGLTEGCLGCRCLAEAKRARGHSEGCRTLEAEIAKTEGRMRLTTACIPEGSGTR